MVLYIFRSVFYQIRVSCGGNSFLVMMTILTVLIQQKQQIQECEVNC